MTRYGRRALVEAIAVVVGVVALFWLLQEPARDLEAMIAARLANRFGGGTVFNIRSTILVFPNDRQMIPAVLLPSCSALASVLSTVVVFMIGRRRPLGRRLAATATAAAAVFAGNMLRLAGSLIVGSYGGRFALVAFHDVAGGTFTFVYVVGSFALGLRALLPPGDGAGSALRPTQQPEVAGVR